MNPRFSLHNSLFKTIVLVFLVVFAISLMLWFVIWRTGTLEQPIAFPHDIHARDNGIPCLYCHTYARLSTVAGVPTVKKCMLCHQIYGGDKEGVKKLREFWENQEDIPWKRIYTLPDYVYFSHKRHVNEGVGCRECHGPVEQMKVITKYSSLEMGWCLECHKARKVSVDCLICHK